MTTANMSLPLDQQDGVWSWIEQHRATAAAGLVAGHLAIIGASAGAFHLAMPDVSGYVQSGVITIAIAIGWAVALTRGAWAREIGFTKTAEWAHLRLLVFPAVLALLPLFGGVHGESAAMLALMVGGYVATALFEETLFRGVLLRIFLPSGTSRAIVVSSLLFGLMHLQNILFRDNPMIVFSQAIGVFCFGVGYSVLRLRTNTIWPLIALHFLTDFTLQLTNLPLGAKIGLMVVQDTLLLIYGIYLLRRSTVRPAAAAS